MTRRWVIVALGLLGAVVVGGISQAFLWRWGPDSLSNMTGSQFMWVLLAFGVSWAWADGRLGAGTAAGAMTGLALIASYYAMQWLADGRHSAVAQFTRTGGVAWTLACVGGGAVIGLFGALAGMHGGDRARLKALGITTPALVVSVGPVLWILTNGTNLPVSQLLLALAVFVLVGVTLLVVTFRACGAAACAQGLLVSLGLCAVALGGLLMLETHGWLYLTF